MDLRNECPDASAGDELDKVVAEYVAALQRGERVDRAEWLARHAVHAAELRAFFDDYDRFGRLSEPLPPDGIDPYSLVGTRLGDYEVEAQVARGGMGAVFRALQVSVGRRVALKLVLGGRLASAEERQRFQGEALAAAKLEHPGIVKVFDVGEIDGRPYYTMPFFEGGSLAARLAEFSADPRRAARLVSAVARAAHFANEAGIVHRDIKPSNILLDALGGPYLADFGLAKEAGSSRDLTRTGSVVGTAEYIAPELSQGKKTSATRAADVYSLGAVLYEVLAGAPPFRGATQLETLELARRTEPLPLRKRNRRVAKDLETVCLKCLAKEPRRRYPTAQDVAEDLDRWLRGEPIVARPMPRWEHGLKWALRHPTLSMAVLVASLALFTVLVLSHLHNIRLQAALDGSRRHLYLSTMRLAYEAARDGRADEVEVMLESQRPAPGEDDLRSFDWQVLRRFAGARRWSIEHPAAVERVLFHPTQLVLACGGRDGVVYVWDLESERLVARLEVFPYAIRTLEFSRDGALLAAVGSREASLARSRLPVTLWNWRAGHKVVELGDVPAEIVGVHFDASAERLLVCAASSLQVRSLPSGALSAKIDAAAGHPFEFSASSTGERELAAASSSRARDWCLYDLKARKAVPSLPLPSGEPATCMAMAPDGEWMAHAFAGGRGFLMRPGTDEAALPLDGLRGTTAALAFSRDGRLLAAGSRGARGGGELTIHEVPSGLLLARSRAHSGAVASLAFSPAGDLVATCGEDGEARVWECAALTLPESRRLRAAGRALAISSSGALLAVASVKHNVTIEDFESGAVRSELPSTEKTETLAFSPDDSVLACAAGRQVELWSVLKSQRLAELPGHRGVVRRVRYDPSGRFLASASLGDLKVWDAASAAEVASLRPHSDRVLGLAFTPDGRRVLTAGLDGRLVSTRVGTWESSLLALLPSPVHDLALSQDRFLRRRHDAASLGSAPRPRARGDPDDSGPQGPRVRSG
jgi:WD40 repeat protein